MKNESKDNPLDLFPGIEVKKNKEVLSNDTKHEISVARVSKQYHVLCGQRFVDWLLGVFECK